MRPRMAPPIVTNRSSMSGHEAHTTGLFGPDLDIRQRCGGDHVNCALFIGEAERLRTTLQCGINFLLHLCCGEGTCETQFPGGVLDPNSNVHVSAFLRQRHPTTPWGLSDVSRLSLGKRDGAESVLREWAWPRLGCRAGSCRAGIRGRVSVAGCTVIPMSIITTNHPAADHEIGVLSRGAGERGAAARGLALPPSRGAGEREAGVLWNR